MDVSHLLTQTVTVTRVAQTGPVDKYGNPTAVETSATFRGHLQPLSRLLAGTEVTAGRDTQMSRRVLFLELAASGLVDGTDRVEIDGVTFELDGPPAPWHNPQSRRVEYLEAELVRVI